MNYIMKHLLYGALAHNIVQMCYWLCQFFWQKHYMFVIKASHELSVWWLLIVRYIGLVYSFAEVTYFKR